MPKEKLKLTTELVPETAWYSNLRKRLSNTEWNKIRKKAYSDYNHKCGICGEKGMLHCHENWEYDDEKHVQKLRNFIALCVMCHHIKHLGLAGILSQRGKLNFDDVVDHFIKINKCDKDTFKKHKKKAFELWEERSRHEWKTDLGEYKDIID